MNILDPACGSGSFLVRAYDHLLNWYLKQYTQKQVSTKNEREGKIYKASRDTYRLSIPAKQEILKRHIYGVDIDRQAVEVTKLSLLLKLMEGESDQTAAGFLRFDQAQLLPDLSTNIKCGNSLIGSDFYKGKNLSLFGKEEKMKINIFDWDRVDGFPEIMKSGGFDCVIGNPPYGGDLINEEKQYLAERYPQVADYETAQYFIAFLDKKVSKNSLIGFIIPNTTFLNLFAENFRNQMIKQFQIKKILNLDEINVFEGATVRTSIPILSKNFKNEKTLVYKYMGNKVVKSKEIKREQLIESKNWTALFQEDSAINLKNKIMGSSFPLKEILNISQGLIPYDKYRGHDEYTIKNRIWHADHKKNITYKKELRGGDVTRYNVEWNGKQWISYGEWLAAPRKKEYFTSPRLLFREITDPKTGFLYVGYTQDEYYNNPGIINAIELPNSKYNLLYLLGLVNSKLIAFLHYHFSPKAKKGVFPKILVNDVRTLPIKKIDFSIRDQKSQHDRMVSLVDQMLTTQKRLHETNSPIEKKQYQQEADILDKQIDALVYELYELTPEEIRIVEG